MMFEKSKLEKIYKKCEFLIYPYLKESKIKIKNRLIKKIEYREYNGKVKFSIPIARPKNYSRDLHPLGKNN